MKVITNGAPKSGSTALTSLLADGFGLEKARGVLSMRERGAVYVHFDDQVYRAMPDADEWHGRTLYRNRIELRRLKRISPFANGLAGVPDGGVIHAHLPPTRALSEFKVVTVLRDPRNNTVSWFRAKIGYGLPNERRRQRFARFIDRDDRFIPWMRAVWRWREQSLGIVVAYERLFDPETVERVSAYIERAPVDAAHLYGRGPNWSGAPSQWQEWFTQAAYARFRERWGDLPMEL